MNKSEVLAGLHCLSAFGALGTNRNVLMQCLDRFVFIAFRHLVRSAQANDETKEGVHGAVFIAFRHLVRSAHDAQAQP